METNRYDVNPMRLGGYSQAKTKKLLKKKFVTGQTKDKIMENILNMSDSDEEGKDKAGNALDKEQLRRMEQNEVKGTKQDKKRKRMENKGVKVETDSDENSLDELEDNSDDDKNNLEKSKAKQEAKEEESKEHKPLVKSREEIKRAAFMGEKFGHFKIGTYVRIEIQVEKKFSR